MKTIDTANFSGKKVLLRVDFNVPLDADFQITDDNRIQGALPTIRKLLDDGAAVILLSHMGRPKGQPNMKYSLKHIVNHLQRVLGREIAFAMDCIGLEAEEKAAALQPGEVLLLENLRFHPGEEEGDRNFAKALAG